MSNDIANIDATKCMLTSKFDMKDLGVADLILGIKIHKTSQGLALSQSHCIKTLLEKFKHLGFKVVKTPIDVNLALAKNKDQSISQLDNARVLGCLVYIMNCTWPYIACAISKLSRYTSNLGQSYWMAIKRVLGHLVHTQDFALPYSKYPAVIEGYCDTNWITGSADSKSTSGYVFIIGGGAVS
ncbi:secreted RxLR effector protein 161-like [Nicotiana sylvestris]|uniref:secreted RxLR effector protein 161-like n=1 Tax=Nicotiana sylvestris TaxID=4096 RepID=UPI00388CAC85